MESMRDLYRRVNRIGYFIDRRKRKMMRLLIGLGGKFKGVKRKRAKKRKN